MKLTVQVRKPDGRILETITAKPMRGDCIIYNKELCDLKRDGEQVYIVDDYPEPTDQIVPLEVSDPELGRLIAWFVQNRREIYQLTGVRSVKFF